MGLTRRTMLAAVGASGVARQAVAQMPVRAVVELFTSQGCSSCPPADRLLGELARDPGLVVLSLPVDYWDSLGWKDSFAQPQFTRRQRDYAMARGGEIYTPQAVVNGAAFAVGSDRGEILALARAALPGQITIERDGPRLVAGVHGAPSDAVLIMAPLLRARTVAIGRGENAHAHVTYTNIATDLIAVGPIGDGQPRRLPTVGDAEGLALIVQRGGLDRPGPILAGILIDPRVA